MASVGIDFGTTYCNVGIWQNNSFQMIPDEYGEREILCCVSFGKEILFGTAAGNACLRNIENTIFDIKRIIGRQFNDPIIQKYINLWDFKIIQQTQNRVGIQVEYNKKSTIFSPEEIVSMIFKHLTEISTKYIGSQVTNTVLTIPACFNELQRKAIKDAAIISELNILRIISEPIATGISYLFEQKTRDNGTFFDIDRNVLIFDFGGGIFDISLLVINHNIITIKSTFGCSYLGGNDFDILLMNHFSKEFKRKNKMDCSKNKRAMRRLRVQCERAKIALSVTTRANIEIDSLFDGIDFATTICRARPEDLFIKYIKQCINLENVINVLLIDAEINKCDIDEIILVGGSTRIPKIRQIIKQIFNGKELYKWYALNPVVKGASILANILSENVIINTVNGFINQYSKFVPLEIKKICMKYYYNYNKINIIGDISIFDVNTLA